MGKAQTPGRRGSCPGRGRSCPGSPQGAGVLRRAGSEERAPGVLQQVRRRLGSQPPLPHPPLPSFPISEMNIFSCLYGFCLFVCIYFQIACYVMGVLLLLFLRFRNYPLTSCCGGRESGQRLPYPPHTPSCPRAPHSGRIRILCVPQCCAHAIHS